ncbi:MAG TPA: hypothetical protein VKF42_02165 [Chitinivibrionales bacterium]|nr:hypothetical protein [Chitinivibrionales bacterium]
MMAFINFAIRTLPAIVLIFLPVTIHAAVINATSCSQADVQAAINSAASGDTVALPAGTGTWSGVVTVHKGITLQGAGAGATIINNAMTGSYTGQLVCDTGAFRRFTGITFNGNTAAVTVYNVEVGGAGVFRIDHCVFTVPSGGTAVQLWGGTLTGLIDHDTFNASGNAEIIHNSAYGPSDTSGWGRDIVPGSADAVYIEDNTFFNNATGNPAYFWGCSAVQSYYGARTVFRHNSIEMAQIDQHGTPGMIGARWWEIYENTFSTTVPNASQCCYITLRAGSGVVFNNHHTGVNQVTGSIDLYEEDSGYPALYQIGRGKNQVSDPAYVWNNDASMPVGSQTPAMVQVNRDYFLSARPGYVPYTYPHPLAGTGISVTEQPTREAVSRMALRIMHDPSNRTVVFRLPDVNSVADVTVISLAGKRVDSFSCPAGAKVFRDATSYSRGVYFVRVSTQ